LLAVTPTQILQVDPVKEQNGEHRNYVELCESEVADDSPSVLSEVFYHRAAPPLLERCLELGVAAGAGEFKRVFLSWHGGSLVKASQCIVWGELERSVGFS
jgi:hypothetical protein